MSDRPEYQKGPFEPRPAEDRKSAQPEPTVPPTAWGDLAAYPEYRETTKPPRP